MKEAEMNAELIYNLPDFIPGSEIDDLSLCTWPSDVNRRAFLSNRLCGFADVGVCQ